MNQKKEVRCAGCEIRMNDQEGNLPQLEGYAALFNSEIDMGGYYREVIRPGAFDTALKEKHDVRALIDHKHHLIVGRVSAGTLELSVDERGLKVLIHPTDTTTYRDLVNNVKAGNISQMSFAFRLKRAIWTQEEGLPDLREIEDVELIDVSPVTFPAYPDTEITARSAQLIWEERQSEVEKSIIPASVKMNHRRRKLDLRERT